MVKNKSQFALSPTNPSFRTARYSTTNTQKTSQLKINTYNRTTIILMGSTVDMIWYFLLYTCFKCVIISLLFENILFFYSFYIFVYVPTIWHNTTFGFMCSLLVRQFVKLNFSDSYLNLVNFEPGQKQIRLKLIFPEFVKISRIVISYFVVAMGLNVQSTKYRSYYIPCN